ncbi:MAG TPA: malonyl-ACP O-methyltransferase BioC [Xanthomonadaceae bacterium]|nr:malonyl-ACP O-methyltransferase BioC [Xanthomonadaceae bacterium]
MSRPPATLFDTRQVRRAFSRAAGGYDSAAALQHEVESRLLESLDYYDMREAGRLAPEVVVDLGSGPGSAARALRRRWPRSRVVAVDIALPMLREARRRAPAWRPFQRGIDLVCGDARALPLAEGSVDVLVSNLCLQWVDDLPATFAGLRRALKPGGLLLLSTFGSETLHELHEAFASVDATPHVSPFADIARFGDALVHAGFRDPVLDRDLYRHHHPDLSALMRQLRALGATNALAGRRRTLTGRARFAAAAAAYEPLRTDAGLPATWEVIQAHAWAPPPGAPIRETGYEVTSVPVSQIPIRRRK